MRRKHLILGATASVLLLIGCSGDQELEPRDWGDLDGPGPVCDFLDRSAVRELYVDDPEARPEVLRSTTYHGPYIPEPRTGGRIWSCSIMPYGSQHLHMMASATGSDSANGHIESTDVFSDWVTVDNPDYPRDYLIRTAREGQYLLIETDDLVVYGRLGDSPEGYQAEALIWLAVSATDRITGERAIAELDAREAEPDEQDEQK